MDSVQLLIFNESPETAEQVNNQARNSGINIRINLIQSLVELEFHLSQEVDCLLLLGENTLNTPVVHQVMELLAQYPVPTLFSINPDKSDMIGDAISSGPCLVIDKGSDNQLCEVLRQQLSMMERASSEQAIDEQVQDLNQLLHALLESSVEPIAYLHQGLHVHANQAYLECLQLNSTNQLTGVSVLEIMQGVETDLKQVLRQLGNGTSSTASIPVSVQAPGGVDFLTEMSLSPVRYEQEDCVQITLRQVDHSARIKAELESFRSIDPLTVMMRRESFIPTLADYLQNPLTRSASSALLFMQPDGFEEYLNTLGHVGADQFLTEFAAVVRKCLGEKDLACRFSDHAFAVLVRREEETSIDRIAHAILDACSHHQLELEHLTLSTSCSIGVVKLGLAVTDADEAIGQARTACARAAEQGQQVVRYKPRLSMVALDESSEQGWRERLRFGLDHGRFYSLQQEIVDVEGNREGLFENHSYLREESGDIDQDEFMGAAEVCEMGGEIDRMLIPGLLSAMSCDSEYRRHVVNISLNSMLDESFPAWLGQQLAEREIPGSNLVLQVSAESALAHQARATRLVNELRPLGCGFALTGFDDDPQHLRLLGKLGVSLIKLRKDLISDLSSQESQKEVAKALVKTAASAGVDVVADGIREATHLAALWQVGITLVGGEFLQETPQVVGQ